MKTKLSCYIIPSVISMVLIGTYTNIDGYFIGNTTGDDGLAAINIVWPIVALITSIGTGIGVGGCAFVNRLRGNEKTEKAKSVEGITVTLLFLFGVLLSVVLTLCYKPILRFLGASGNVFVLADNYSNVISIGACFQIVGAGVIAILRNDGKTYISMIYTIIGLIVHIILDALLAPKYNLFGVGLSTVIAQFVISVLGIISLKIKPEIPKAKDGLAVIKHSTAPFGINFVPSVVLMLTNVFALKIGGTAAVSAYAVMSYAIYTYDYFFQGVCDGIQPLLSFAHGSKNMKHGKYIGKIAIVILMVSSLAFIAITPVLIKVLPRLFAVSFEAEIMIKSGLIIYAFALPLKAIVKYVCSYYYSIGKTGVSNLIIFLDPLVLTPISLTAFTYFFNTDGIWLSMTGTQFMLAFIAIFVYIKNNDWRKNNV